MVTSHAWLLSIDFLDVYASVSCLLFAPISLHMLKWSWAHTLPRRFIIITIIIIIIIIRLKYAGKFC